MKIQTALIAGAVVALGSVFLTAQSRQVPRPPAGAPPATDSAAPDGYQPLPQWLGQTRAPMTAKTETFTVETVAQGFNGAGGFRFLPDGRIIVFERAGGGKIVIVGKDGKNGEPLTGLPANMFKPQQGQSLNDVVVDRNFATNRTLYISYAVLPEGADPAKQRNPAHFHIASAKLSADGKSLENVKDLLDTEGTGAHLVQANDGTLLIATTVPAGPGIRSEDWQQPQQLDSLMGKVLRINADGSIPKDNPFAGKAGARGEIYALGIRDDQGLAIHPKTGRLWTSEHGPRGGDEINEIAKGKNYGFPVIGYGRDYSGKPINNDKTVQAGMEQPVYFFTPDIAPGGIAFYTGRMFPAWDGSLFVSGLVTKNLIRLQLNGNRVVGEERLLGDMDTRIRDVKEGPDGALYALTDGPGAKILKLKKG